MENICAFNITTATVAVVMVLLLFHKSLKKLKMFNVLNEICQKINQQEWNGRDTVSTVETISADKILVKNSREHWNFQKNIMMMEINITVITITNLNCHSVHLSSNQNCQAERMKHTSLISCKQTLCVFFPSPFQFHLTIKYYWPQMKLLFMSMR